MEPRYGWVEMPDHLVEREAFWSPLLQTAIEDCKREAGLTDERYYVRLAVIELLPDTRELYEGITPAEGDDGR
jgi:hypothetical protein